MQPPQTQNEFIPTKEAAKLSGYSADYLAKLARSGEVRAQQQGRTWFVDALSLQNYLQLQEQRKRERMEALASSRAAEYHEHQASKAPPKPQKRPWMPIVYTKPAALPSAAPRAAVIAAMPQKPLTRAVAMRDVRKKHQEGVAQASPFATFGAVTAACAVLATGALIAQTPLLPNLAERTLATAGEASEGFAALVAPMAAHMAQDLERMHSIALSPTQMMNGEDLRPAGPGAVAALYDPGRMPADLTNIYKGKFDTREVEQTRSVATTKESTNLLASVANGLANATHALIAGEVSLVYAVPHIAPALAYDTIAAVWHTGDLATRGTEVLGKGSSTVLWRSGAYALALVTDGLWEVAHASGSVGASAIAIASSGSKVMGNAKNMLQNLVSTAGTRALVLGESAISYVRKDHVGAVAGAGATSPPQTGTLAAVGAATTTPSATTAVGGPTLVSAGALPAVARVPVVADTLSYGDIIDYDQETGAYRASMLADDPYIYGVAVKDPPVLLVTDDNSAGITVMETGTALVNVTLENGPIARGDLITTSSVAGKGMRAGPGAGHVVGIALEPFTGERAATTSAAVNGRPVALGTIAVDVRIVGVEKGSGGLGGCTAGPVLCALAAKVNAAPLVSILRYLVAALVAVGSVYLAFRTFIADAVNGVISVGRNPRAKSAIQAMVIFNGILGAAIALAGLAAGITILLIQL